MSDEEDLKEESEGGLPPWLATFADLMSLLMCFFVLLLSFSEMDAQKFKRLAGSMAQAFGVQNRLEVMEAPKGTSIVAQEFGPSIPEPTPLAEIYQRVEDVQGSTLDIQCSDQFDVEQGHENLEGPPKVENSQLSDSIEKRLDELIAQTEADASDFADALAESINSGKIEVETQGRTIVIRIKEAGSFMTHSAALSADYVPILEKVRKLLKKKAGRVSVEGHTDNIRVSNDRFRSNWELSSARAVSVSHELLAYDELHPERFSIVGYGETRPISTNDTTEGRSLNRRVEIMLHQSVDDVALKRDLQQLKYESPDEYQRLKPRYQFQLREDEIF